VEVVTASSVEVIANVARDRGVDLIAMATHGRGGLARAVMGSVATATIQRAGVPILLTRPAEVQTARADGPERAERTDEEASSETRPVTMILTTEERGLVQAGLELPQGSSEREDRHAAPIRAILALESHTLRRIDPRHSGPTAP
jgi:hypothetical protein